VTGYLDPLYAKSLATTGQPQKLEQSGGWILRRQIEGCSFYDGMGCYPIFCCSDWSRLHVDLSEAGIEKELVSLVVVTDPFGTYDVDYLRNCFQELVVPFKEHYVVDLSRDMETFVSNHHRRNARIALREVKTEICSNSSENVTAWIRIYNNLIDRHNIKGVPAFSAVTLSAQLQVPGLVLFRAAPKRRNEETIGMSLWYIQGNVAYYHLGAYDNVGYSLKASFALFWQALQHFAAIGVQWLSLGAGAGTKSNGSEGLIRFKQGWSTGTRTAYLCGRIFDKDKCAEIMLLKDISSNRYFPPYRFGEFI